jgi:hypothetical protein
VHYNCIYFSLSKHVFKDSVCSVISNNPIDKENQHEKSLEEHEMQFQKKKNLVCQFKAFILLLFVYIEDH